MIRQTAIVVLLAACLFSAVPAMGFQKNAGLKNEPAVEFTTNPELLKFVCEENEAWNMREIPLSESVGIRKGKVIDSPAISEDQQKQLAALAEEKGIWSEKLLQMAAITPLYVRIACKQANHRPVAGVVEKFGEPDSKEANAVIYKSGPTQESGEWYYYGAVRLGVRKNGDIMTVQIDSPGYRRYSEQVIAESAPPKRAAPKTAADIAADPRKAEQIAANRLKLAKQMLANNSKKAREWLNDILTRYPDTPSAAAARELLKDAEE